MKGVLDEIVKLIEEYILGFSVSIGRGQMQKLAIIRMIKIIKTVIGLFTQDPQCDEEETIASFISSQLSREQGYMAYQDENGDIRIEEPDAAVEPARAVLSEVITPEAPQVQALPGVQPFAVTPDTKGMPGLATRDGKTLLQTGQPVIDAQLAGIVAKITTPAKVVFGCPHNISVTDVDQINSWISGS